jgi:O-antigen ligase
MTTLAYGALWFFIFAVPWERLVAVPGLSIVTRVAGAVALGLTVLSVVVQGRVRRWRLFHIAALLFVVWAGFGIWYLSMSIVPQKFYTFAQLFVVVIMVWELASTPQRQRGLLVAYVFGAAVPAIATIVLYVQGGGTGVRYSAGGADANNLAMTLALGLPIAWYLGMTSSQPLARWIFRAYIPLCILATALSGSRGGMLTLIIALLVVPLTLTLSAGRLTAAIALLTLSGALAVAYVPDKVVERLGTTSTEVQDARFGGRIKLWRAGIVAFTSRPLMGYGVSSFVPAIKPQLGPMALVAHNSFLSVLVEEGMIGLLFYLLMLLSVFLSIRKLPHLERRFSMVLLLTLCAAQTPLTWEDSKVAWLIMALLVGMLTLRMTAARSQPRAPAMPHPISQRRPLAGRVMEDPWSSARATRGDATP